MSLFNAIASAIESPDRQASPNQLGSILGTIQQVVGNSNASPQDMQTLMSVVGKYVRSSLQDQRNSGGESQANQLVNQFGGTQPNASAVNALLSAPQVQQLVQEVEQRTGIESGTVENLLPMAVPLVLNLLQTGNDTNNPQGGSNSVLTSFLDADGDGDTDISDALQMASKFL